MEDEGSYGIISYRELVNLKKEIEELKNKTTTDSNKMLLDSMAKLTQNMNSMLELFKSAADELKIEESSQMSIVKELTPLSEKIEQILQQTKTIAEGMVSIADMVAEIKDKKEIPLPNRIQQPPENAFQNTIIRPQQPMPPPIQQPMTGQMIGGFQPPMRQPLMPPPQYARNDMPQPQFPPMGAPELPDDMPLEPFPPLPESPKKGIFGRFKK